jgi:biotin operon repressor
MARKRRSGRRVDLKGRSEGKSQYFALSYRMLHSEAWRTLGGAAIKVYGELRSRFNGFNNGKLFLSLEEAAGLLELGKATVMRAFTELEEKGFIVRTRRGSWYGRQASEWAVTDQELGGQQPTNAWKHWRPPGPARPSVLRWTEKTKRGSGMDPSAVATGAEMDRGRSDGSATAPVTPLRAVAIGSRMDR